MANEKAQLGERIRSARASKGWKQKHLAAQVEVEPITVSRWERGATTPDLDVLGRVAQATGKPVSYFVGGSTEPPSSGGGAPLEDAARRIETAALQIAAEVDRLAGAIDELRAELARSR
ncbi:MAG TPA: helix-turn-helix transcriptional regulator [Gaiellaceae bacterium]|nr:helix-turn-helix transcriptional regulator [Gaiellaceae bacterium]